MGKDGSDFFMSPRWDEQDQVQSNISEISKRSLLGELMACPHCYAAVEKIVPRIYPNIPSDIERRLEAVKLVSVDDPDYFRDPACPYPWLAQYMKRETSEDRIRLFNEHQDAEEASETVIGEIQATIEEMKGLERELSDADASDRLAFYKAKTAMLEKWTSLKEKLINMKWMSDFQKRVIAIMEEVMDKDQQQEMKRRLKGLPQ